MKEQFGEQISFKTLKQEIINIISGAELITSTKDLSGESGIYLLYVDNFNDDKIIPFYIGKTNNFKRRYREHIRDVEELLQSDYDDYRMRFFCSAVGYRKYFEGKYRRCKMLKYIVDHNCSLEDIKMVVLEKCDAEVIMEREQYYLNKYLPSFFGFNQIATITEQKIYNSNRDLKKRIIDTDYQNFLKYMEYGYSCFNYLHAFSIYKSDELDEKINLLLSNHLWQSKDELLSKTNAAYADYKDTYDKAFKVISDKFADSVHEIFNTHKFKSKGREQEVLSVFTLNNHNDAEYLEYYFNRDKRSKRCGEELKNLYIANEEVIKRITEPVYIAYESYVKNINRTIEQSEYSIIFSNKMF